MIASSASFKKLKAEVGSVSSGLSEFRKEHEDNNQKILASLNQLVASTQAGKTRVDAAPPSECEASSRDAPRGQAVAI